MSVFDRETVCKTPCPDCGGKIFRDYFGGDCRGNPPETTFCCKGFCKRNFSEKEWKNISRGLKIKRRKPRRIYEVVRHKYGKEITIAYEHQPISWKKLQEIIADEFSNCPPDRVLVMTNDDCSLGIGEDAPEGFWKKVRAAGAILSGVRGSIGGQK